MPSHAIRGAVVVITGASEGIGRAAALSFARERSRVVIAARSEDRLREVEAGIVATGADCLVVPTDVTIDVQVKRLAAASLERFGRIDILVCNAGVGLYGRLADLPLDMMRRLFEVNVYGTLRCIQAALPAMMRQKTGLVQIVSSVLGRRSIPGYGAYCASKFALYALAESLRTEIEGTGVDVQTVYPALTDTRFSTNALTANPNPPRLRMRRASAAEVARVLVRAARLRPRDQFVTWSGRVLALANGLSPGVVDAIVSQVTGAGVSSFPGGPGAVSGRRE